VCVCVGVCACCRVKASGRAMTHRDATPLAAFGLSDGSMLEAIAASAAQ